MLETVIDGKVFMLKDLVKYDKDQSVSKTVIEENGSKAVVVALDHGTLAAHAAPADVIFTVLEGSGTLTYQGKPIQLKHGDSVKLVKGAIHSVTADDKMKFLLMLF